MLRGSELHGIALHTLPRNVSAARALTSPLSPAVRFAVNGALGLQRCGKCVFSPRSIALRAATGEVVQEVVRGARANLRRDQSRARF
jgi:hypothetical protein